MSIRIDPFTGFARAIAAPSLLALALMIPGCGHDHEAAPGGAPGDDAPADDAGAMAPGAIAIPDAVRRNLGITFVTTERRRVEQTLRVPGRFEYLPTARREYRTMLPGRVELLVEQFDRVEAGQALYRIDSPAWREMQQQLSGAGSDIERLNARVDTFEPLWAAHERHEQSLDETITIWRERVAQLDEVRAAGGGRIDEVAQAQSALATNRAELASVQEKKAELQASRDQSIVDVAAARSRLVFLLQSAAAIVGRTPEQLAGPAATAPDGRPMWASIDRIEVTATEPGVIEQLGLTNGAWADQKSAVLTVVRPDQLRFRASGLQSDLGVLRDGLTARIVPPTPTATGRAVPISDTMDGTITLGLTGDAADRTIDVYTVPLTLAAWARPGVTAQLEIVTDATAATELTIPLAAVQRDGLSAVIFRRSPRNPDEAIRVEANLGADDGRWVVVREGLRDGDQIVLDGAFQLMLATSGSIQKGGHFHADGTFHDGEH